ncbi:MAG TPA: patatin-like protein [Aldersonia sp.]
MAERTELRLALVCYGGVSLAVYMHGITKELHNLVRAARAFDELDERLAGPNPFDPKTTTQAAYFEELRRLAKAGRRMSVSVDVIAGTSAGGINGIVLAKAIAQDANQDRLKELWIKEGDLADLVRWPRIGGVRLRAVLAAGWQLVRPLARTSLLRGERMSGLLRNALHEIEKTAAGTLIPDDSDVSLQLHVTTTDLSGYQVLVPSGAGGASQRDTSYAQVLTFAGAEAFDGETNTNALAFAARATASFPGAFSPVSWQGFAAETGVETPLPEGLFRHGYVAGDEMVTRFVDGGVLDNAPFDLVIEAIGRCRASREVLRRLVYIQPDPGAKLSQPDPQPHIREDEGWLPDLWQLASKVRGSQSLLAHLTDLRDLNLRISLIAPIVELQQTKVAGEIGIALEGMGIALPQDPMDALSNIDTEARVKSMTEHMHARAEKVLGPSWATYQRLKVIEAGRRIADEVIELFVFPPESGRASFVRAAISAWAQSRDEWQDADPSKLVERLRHVDVPYRERRAMLVLQGINDLYRAKDPPDNLSDLKKRAWDHLQTLRKVPAEVVRADQGTVAFLAGDILDAHLLDSPGEFATQFAEEFEGLFVTYRQALEKRLDNVGAGLWRLLVESTAAWPAEQRHDLLSRYIGFPLWDGIIFPTIALAELPQFSPIPVTQFSPLAAEAIRPTDPKRGKLEGVGLHHFKAFLKPAWRENDYLWGRLDGVELILRMLGETEGRPVPDGAEESRARAIREAGSQLAPGLRAVLASERTDLKDVGGLLQHVDREIDEIENGR